MDGPERSGVPHPVRGTVVAIVAVPVIMVGAVLVLATVSSMVLTGLDPRNWLSSNAADWLWGTGVAGDAAHFVRFMIGGLMAGGGVSAIRWGYHGTGGWS